MTAGEEPGNRCNDYGRKAVLTDTWQIELGVPRDRQASFGPQLIAKSETRILSSCNRLFDLVVRFKSEKFRRSDHGRLTTICRRIGAARLAATAGTRRLTKANAARTATSRQRSPRP